MADKLNLGPAIGPLLDKLVYERFLKWITPEKLQEMGMEVPTPTEPTEEPVK